MKKSTQWLWMIVFYISVTKASHCSACDLHSCPIASVYYLACFSITEKLVLLKLWDGDAVMRYENDNGSWEWLWLQSFSFIWAQELNILSSCDNGINVFFQVYKKNRRTFIQDNDPITLLSQGNDCYPEDNEIINSAQIKLLQPHPFLASVEDYITHFNLNICCHNILCTKIFCTHPLDE